MKMERLPQIPQCIGFFLMISLYAAALESKQRPLSLPLTPPSDRREEKGNRSKKTEATLNTALDFTPPRSSFHHRAAASTHPRLPHSPRIYTSAKLHTFLNVNNVYIEENTR